MPQIRLGFALHLRGMVREKQGRKTESYNDFLKALSNFKATLGMNSFRVGQVCLKLAEHHAQTSQSEAAR